MPVLREFDPLATSVIESEYPSRTPSQNAALLAALRAADHLVDVATIDASSDEQAASIVRTKLLGIVAAAPEMARLAPSERDVAAFMIERDHAQNDPSARMGAARAAAQLSADERLALVPQDWTPITPQEQPVRQVPTPVAPIGVGGLSAASSDAEIMAHIANEDGKHLSAYSTLKKQQIRRAHV